MAKTPFHAVVKTAQSYTVPASKYVIFTAYKSNSGGIDMFLNGQYFAEAVSGSGAGGLTAKAGDVLTVGGSSSEVSCVGFLYDA